MQFKVGLTENTYIFPNLSLIYPKCTRVDNMAVILKELSSRIRRSFTTKAEADGEIPNRWQYDHIYRSYASKPSPRLVPWRVSRPNQQLIDVFEIKRVKPPMSVLDLGCGAGKNAKYLSERGFTVVGIDFSAEALKLARTLKVASPLIVADAAALPFKENAFDMVVDVGCLHSIPPSIRWQMKEWVTWVLRPKGQYFLRVWLSFADDYGIERPMFYLNKVPVWGFNPSLLSDIFSEDLERTYLEFGTDEDHYGPFITNLMTKK